MNIGVQTERLILRNFEGTDVADFVAFQSHPEVRRFSGGSPMDEERAAAFINAQSKLTDRQRGAWHSIAVEHRNDRRVIGEVGVFLPAEPDDEGDIGFQFHPEYQHQGYALEAASALMGHLFNDLGLARLTANCDRQNERSYHLMVRLGMKDVSESQPEPPPNFAPDLVVDSTQPPHGESLTCELSRDDWLTLGRVGANLGFGGLNPG